ncbi:hypothetical protein OAF78_03155 [Winogradskyella sp.]|nr:hypothetical protein [Winogradskyella sp.]MDB4752741.1 hypothetical protein [Winogradskyella sp.]
MNNILVYGASGQVKMIMDIIHKRNNYNIVGLILNSNVKIGRDRIINTNGSLGQGSKMINFSNLTPGVTTGSSVKIGDSSAICIEATLVNNINIGRHKVIGASSLSSKDVGDHKLAYGSPITVTKDREKDYNYYSKYNYVN